VHVLSGGRPGRGTACWGWYSARTRPGYRPSSLGVDRTLLLGGRGPSSRSSGSAESPPGPVVDLLWPAPNMTRMTRSGCGCPEPARTRPTTRTSSGNRSTPSGLWPPAAGGGWASEPTGEKCPTSRGTQRFLLRDHQGRNSAWPGTCGSHDVQPCWGSGWCGGRPCTNPFVKIADGGVLVWVLRPGPGNLGAVARAAARGRCAEPRGLASTAVLALVTTPGALGM
jgi:hypothetical protein